MQNGVLQPGQLIAGKYVVERVLGRGGMGVVYVVSHRMTGKRLALKCLLPELVYNADIVERFLREAQATGRITHRNVVDVFDVGRDDDLLYLVMELLDGKPLTDLLHDETLTLEEALAIIVRAMEGVAAAHAHGIVHRDLKPDNIFVCVGPSGRLDDPRVLDFGISKFDDSAVSLTRSGVAMGTPYYMCIEQLRGQRDLDARVDVYALGVILYEAMAGVPPHTAESVSALAIRVLTVAPDDLRVLRPDLPEGLAAVVMKAIARDREDRYPSVQALIDAIMPFVPRSAGLLVPEGQGRPLRTPRSASAATAIREAARREASSREATAARSTPAARAPRRGGLWAGLTLALVVLAGSVVWLSWPSHDDAPPSMAAPSLPQGGSARPSATPEPGDTPEPSLSPKPTVASLPDVVDASSVVEPNLATEASTTARGVTAPAAAARPGASSLPSASTPPGLATPLPAVSPARPSAGSAGPSDTQPSTSVLTKGKRARHERVHSARPALDAAAPPPPSEPAAVPARDVKTVQGRAGKVRSDEF